MRRWTADITGRYATLKQEGEVVIKRVAVLLKLSLPWIYVTIGIRKEITRYIYRFYIFVYHAVLWLVVQLSRREGPFS